MYPRLFLLSTFFLIIPTVRFPVIHISPSDFFIFCAMVWLVGESLLHASDSKYAIPLHILWVPAGLILISGILSSIPALNRLSSLAVVIKVWFVVTIWISMGIVMVRRGYLMPILNVMVLAGAVTSLVAVIDQLTGIHLGDKISSNELNFWDRQIGTFGHPSDLGFYTSVAFPLTAGLILREWQTQQRLGRLFVLSLAFGLIGAALFFSGSVTGWISVVLSVGTVAVILLFRAKRFVQVGVVAITLGLIIVGAFLMTQESIAETVGTVLDYNLNRASTNTGPGRLVLLDEAFLHINDSPLIGIGLDQSGTGDLTDSQRIEGDAIHNTIISGWLNGGLLMFVGMVLVYLIASVTALRAIIYGVRNSDWLIVCMGTAVFGYILFDQTQPHLEQRFTWLVLALLCGLGFGFQSLQVPSVGIVPAKRELASRQEHSSI